MIRPACADHSKPLHDRTASGRPTRPPVLRPPPASAGGGSPDGAALTYRKTAVESAPGADPLAHPVAEVLVIACAGGRAPDGVEARCSVHPIRKVWIWNRSRPGAVAMADALRRSGLEVSAAEDVAELPPEADYESASSRDPTVSHDFNSLLRRSACGPLAD